MQRYFDVVQTPTGDAISGALVSVFISGTTTLATLYVDNGVTLQANPVTTNTDGEYAFYAANGTYVLQITAVNYATETKPGVVLFDPSDNVHIGGQLTAYGSGGDPTNTAIGLDSLATNSTGIYNTAVGYEVLTIANIANYNTGVGYRALRAATTGTNNVAVGAESLSANTAGQNNSAFGKSALAANTIGQGNTGIGANSLLVCSAGIYNTAIGYASGNSITSGQENVAVGYLALDACQTGNDNVAVGNQALRDAVSSNNVSIGNGSLLLAAGTAANNTAVGYYAGANVTSGSNNTIIGYDASVSAGGVSNEITLGNSSITSLRVPGLTLTAGAKWINNGTLTVGTLPAAATAGAGARAVVTDASATTFHSIVAGGGANVVPVFSDGTNWRIG